MMEMKCCECGPRPLNFGDFYRFCELAVIKSHKVYGLKVTLQFMGFMGFLKFFESVVSLASDHICSAIDFHIEH